MGVARESGEMKVGYAVACLDGWMVEGLPKFVPLETVMHDLFISRSQAYALVRSGDLRAIQVGGRGQWRVSLAELEAFIQRKYAETEQR